jgi:HK97 family phage portal protein
VARRFLPALRGITTGPSSADLVAAVLEAKSLADRVRSAATGYTVSGQPYPTTWNVDRAVREGFKANPYVFRAIEVIAFAIIGRKIVLRQGDPDDGDEVPLRQDTTRVLFCLNRRANKWETAKLFRYRLVAQFLLSSKGVYVEVTRSRAGRIAMLTLIDPDLVEIVPSSTDPIAAFRVRIAADDGADYDDLPPFDPEDGRQTNSMLWLRSPHPTILHQGMSPMEAAALSVDLDRYARMYNRDYMQAGGRPGGVLGVRGQITPETIAALEAQFNDSAKLGRTTAISADAMSYQDFSTSPRDMQWPEVMNQMRKEASIVFGVPESLMGDSSGRTFDNADAEYATFWETRVGPLIDLLDDQLDVLTGGFADDTYLRHDVSDVWVLARHKRTEEDRAVADYNSGLITIDDVREVKGHERLDIPATRVLLLPPQKVIVAQSEEAADDAKAVAELPMLGSPSGGGAPAGGDAGGGADAAQTQQLASYNAQTNANAARLRLVAGQAQGRPTSGGVGAFSQRDALGDDGEVPEVKAAPDADVEGEQRGAREAGAFRPPAWR